MDDAKGGTVQVTTRRKRGRREMEILIAVLRRAEIPAAHGTTVTLETKAIDAVTRGPTSKRAEVVGMHFHDLRREFACRLLESGADMHDVRDFLGHGNITTTSRYL